MTAEDIIKEHAYHEAGHYTAAIVMAERFKDFIKVDVQSISLFHAKGVWGDTVEGRLHAPSPRNAPTMRIRWLQTS